MTHLRVLTVVAVGSSTVTQPTVSPEASKSEELQPYTETIPGTAISFEMVPIDRAGVQGWMSTTEVTWNMFDVFLHRLDEPTGDPNVDAISRPSKPYISMDRGFGHDGYAAISMSQEGARAYCKWLSAKTGKTYRLPTEAEWVTAYEANLPSGDLVEHAWTQENSDGTTHPVAKKLVGELGLYDMAGNAGEWVEAEEKDGKPFIKGGSYVTPAAEIDAEFREAQRYLWNASDPQIPKSKWWLADAPFVGFRLMCEPAGEADSRPESNSEESGS